MFFEIKEEKRLSDKLTTHIIKVHTTQLINKRKKKSIKRELLS